MLSLKTKLTCLTLLPFIISFGAFYLLSSFQFSQPLEGALAGEQQAKARLVANDIDRFVTQRVTEARLFAYSEILQSDDFASITAYLINLADNNDLITEIDLIDQTGTIIVHSGAKTDLGGLIWDNYPPLKELFEAARNSGSPDVYILETPELDNQQGAGILLLTPVATQAAERPNRYLLVELTFSPIKKIIIGFQQSLAGGKHVYLVRNDGSIVVTDRKDLQPFELFPDLDRHPDMLEFFSRRGAEGTFNYVDGSGDQITASYIDMGEFGSNLALDWSILVTAATAKIMAPVRTAMQLLLTVGLLLSALMAIIAYTLSRRITVPLGQAVEAAEKVQQGDYRQRLFVTGDKEIKTLADAFNRMVTKIEQHTEDLAEANIRLEIFNTIIEASPMPVYLNDLDGRYLFTNQAFLKLHKLDATEPIGKTSLELFNPDYGEDYFQQVKQVLSSGQQLEESTKVLDGEERLHEVLITKFPVFDAQGKVYAVGGIDIDLTEQKQLEEQLLHAHKMEAIGTLAGGIAHDFNNLLAAMLGHAYLAERKLGENSGAEKNIEQIKSAAIRATELVKQILSFARRDKATLETVNVNNTIQEALLLLQATLPASVEIQQTISAAAQQLTVSADKTQLQQILINLCTNAVHAMQNKGVLRVGLQQITVPFEEIPANSDCLPGDYAQLCIQDTGAGMSEETLGQIFNPFFTTKAVGEGTGMGLSVVHGLVREHKGFIRVDSQLNQGTTFKVYLPLTSNDNPVAAEDAIENLPTGNERILFVDDEEDLAGACVEMLQLQGYAVTSTASSLQALALFQAAPDDYDLLVTDQTMPKMTGTELTVAIRKIRPELPVILCSGYYFEKNSQEAEQLGIQAVCMKPLEMELLTRTVRQVLDDHSH